MKPATPTDPSASAFVNAMRLNARQWLSAGLVLAMVLLLTPNVWPRIERFEPGADYRIPYALSKDYWFHGQRLAQVAAGRVVVLGDSVVWGEYVKADGTLTHFLNELSGQPDRFANAGVNGLFPLALEGLVRSAGGSLRHRQIILHCNLLWLTSPKADLQTDKEERFNHAELVPQFSPRIPCYKADLNRRLSAVVTRNFPFAAWVNHLQIAYFGQKDILSWTLEEDESDPPRRPHAYQNPLAQITLRLPSEPVVDPERGPGSPRHQPWSKTGEGTTRFEWVKLDGSLQWAAFQRLVILLKARGNDVLVLMGPFNEHLMAEDNRAAFRRLRDAATDWLSRNQVACLVPETLPSPLYADASHPLTEGYRALATRLLNDPMFQRRRPAVVALQRHFRANRNLGGRRGGRKKPVEWGGRSAFSAQIRAFRGLILKTAVVIHRRKQREQRAGIGEQIDPVQTRSPTR